MHSELLLFVWNNFNLFFGEGDTAPIRLDSCFLERILNWILMDLLVDLFGVHLGLGAAVYLLLGVILGDGFRDPDLCSLGVSLAPPNAMLISWILILIFLYSSFRCPSSAVCSPRRSFFRTMPLWKRCSWNLLQWGFLKLSSLCFLLLLLVLWIRISSAAAGTEIS